MASPVAPAVAPLATPEFEKSGYFCTVHGCLSLLTE
jgi:hypothetical protein